MNHCVKITFVAPCFSHGATDAPEVRPASIRGMLHHWFRLLGGTIEQERAVFGGVNFGQSSPFRDDSASKVVVRVRHDPGADVRSFPTLPHKGGGRAAPRDAFAPGHSFELFVSDRLCGLKEPEAGLFHDALYAWLLMGTLGFRSTRIAGSFVFDSPDFPQPDQSQAYLDCCRGLLEKHGAPVRVGMLRRSFDLAEEARRLVSDSLGGPHSEDEHDLEALHDPLGKVVIGGSQRKTSPLKYRLLRFGGKFQILAVWDGREKVTGNTLGDLSGVINLLSAKKPDLGRLLAETGMDI